jgi:hypothetical protein
MEPISIAELEADPTMVGFTSLFRIPTTGQPLPQLIPTKEETTPTVGSETTPAEGADAEPTVGFNMPLSANSPHQSSPTVGGIPSPTVGVSLHPPAPFFSAEDGKLYPHQRVRPLREPKDVLSAVELRAFEKLEHLAQPNRHLRIGYDRLAEACSLNEKSVRLLLLRLIEKGFLSIVAPADPDRQLGKEYRVHDLEEARHHHQAKGWQWVVRSGNGILIVKPV